MSAQLSGGKRTSRGRPVSVAIDPVALGYRQIIIESLEILKAIERSGWKRPLGRFFFPLSAVHPIVTVPTRFHGRVAVLPVAAIGVRIARS